MVSNSADVILYPGPVSFQNFRDVIKLVKVRNRNKAALFLLTAYESLWRRMVWKCGNDGFDFQSVRLGGIEPELYSVYQAAKAIAVGCCNITLADLASPELVTDEAFHLITGALLMAKYGDAVLNLEKGVNET